MTHDSHENENHRDERNAAKCRACGDTKIDCPTCGYGMPTAAKVCNHPCMKCVPGIDVAVSYHPRRSYCDPHSRFTFNSREDEHLHYTCRNCGYDWTGDVADAA